MNEIYLQTARLLTRLAPLVLVDDTFALKGGNEFAWPGPGVRPVPGRDDSTIVHGEFPPTYFVHARPISRAHRAGQGPSGQEDGLTTIRSSPEYSGRFKPRRRQFGTP
jgi:hypothetical protein